MSEPQTDEKLVERLLERGVENIIPSKEELKQRLMSGERLRVYYGIDPTAPHIHLGHAFNLRKLQQLVNLGHDVTFLIGDFTALVGDTSDKNDERPQLSADEIEKNVATFKQQASKFLDFDKVTLVHNSEWLSKLNFADIMKIAGNFSVNDFVSRELIRKRLDEGKRVGLIETLYPLMQGYDSYHLDTDLQLGATDQTFNMQAGRTLMKRLREKESFVMASGYLSGTDGRKMSKSWGNAIWLDDAAEDVYGKVMRISDELIEEYFYLGTNTDVASIEEVVGSLKRGESHPMEVKKQLARTITKEICGETAVADAEARFVAETQQKTAGDDSITITPDSLNFKLDTGQSLIDVFLENNLVESKSQARRLFEQGAIRLNEEVITLDDELQLKEGENQIRVGKRRYLIIQN